MFICDFSAPAEKKPLYNVAYIKSPLELLVYPIIATV